MATSETRKPQTQEEADRIREVAAGRPPKPKRFYAKVSVTEDENGFAIALDGRIAKTPKRESLVVPSHALALQMVEEWDAQDTEIDSMSMPLTQLANTAIDGVCMAVDKVLDQVVDYARADLLCYRVAYPEALAVQQMEVWQPVLNWAEKAFGARLVVTTELMAVEQPESSLQAIRNAYSQYCPWRLTAAHNMAGIYDSVTLALAVMEGHISAQAAHDAACLDETFQAAIWGADALAKKRSDLLARDVKAAERFAAAILA